MCYRGQLITVIVSVFSACHKAAALTEKHTQCCPASFSGATSTAALEGRLPLLARGDPLLRARSRAPRASPGGDGSSPGPRRGGIEKRGQKQQGQEQQGARAHCAPGFCLPRTQPSRVGKWQNASQVSAQCRWLCTNHLENQPSEILAGKFCQVADLQQVMTGAGQLQRSQQQLAEPIAVRLDGV